MWAAFQRILAGATDVPEREPKREGRMKVQVHAGVVAADEGTEAARVIGDRVTKNRPGRMLVQEAEGADRAGHQDCNPSEPDVAAAPN